MLIPPEKRGIPAENYPVSSSKGKCPRCDADESRLSQVASCVVVLMTELILSVSGHLGASFPGTIKITNSYNRRIGS